MRRKRVGFKKTMFIPVSWAPMAAVIFVVADIISCWMLCVRNRHAHQSPNESKYFYDIRTSQVDHCLLGIVRLAILVGGMIRFRYYPAVNAKLAELWSLGVAGICVWTGVYSLIKLLLLAEATTDFRLPWFWWLVIWNIVASIICVNIWNKVLENAKLDGKVIDEDKNEEKKEKEEDEDEKKKKESSDSDSDDEDEDKKKSEPLSVKETTSIMWRLIVFAKDDWKLYAIGFAFVLIESGASMFSPYYNGRVMSDAVVEKSYDSLKNSVFIRATISIISGVFSGLSRVYLEEASQKFQTRVRGNLFASLVKQDLGFFDMKKTGQITSRISEDCSELSSSIAHYLFYFLESCVLVVGTLIFTLTLCWQLTVVTLIAVPLISLLHSMYDHYVQSLTEEGRDKSASANEIMQEVLSNIRTVRSFANELNESRKYDDKLMAKMKLKGKKRYVFTGYSWIYQGIELVMDMVCMWYAGHLMSTNRLSTDGLIACLLYQERLRSEISSIGWMYSSIVESVGAAKRVFEWMDREPEVPSDGKEILPKMAGRVEFNDVAFAYPSRADTEVLKGVTFTAEPSQVVALVGPSGSGKSTCISLLEHFYEPSSGSILLDGVPIKQIDHEFLHRMVALVAQEPVLFGLSVRENITYGLKREEWTEEDVINACKLANAHEFITAMPSGYDTSVGEKGIQLSGGQKQRVAIARALVRKPKILLLDEATSALDAESEFMVQQAIHENLRGHTVLLIAHRLSTVEKSDKIVVIDNGKTVQQGTHAQLLSEKGLYRNLVHRQLLGVVNTEEEEWKWWEDIQHGNELKWQFLEHKGPLFPPAYEPLPDNVKFFYDGKETKLSMEAEEVATFYAQILDGEYVKNEIFKKNFFKDWQKIMTSKEREAITDLAKCDFNQIHEYMKKSEEQKSVSNEEMEKLKIENEAIQKEYGVGTVDGRIGRVMDFLIESPSLRLEETDQKMGMVKRRVQPEDIILNCSKDSKLPIAPNGHKWKQIRHDNTSNWLACWADHINRKIRYVTLEDEIFVSETNFCDEEKSTEMKVRQRVGFTPQKPSEVH